MKKQKQNKLPKYLKKSGSLSMVDTELTGVIVATANKPELQDEIIKRWNYYTDNHK